MKIIFKRLTNVDIIALGFITMILIGTLLLMLPIATHQHVSTPFIDALFTATSASCVTGLVVVDTAQHWSFFGQCVILLLIQIGGLGFITIGVFFATYLKRKIGLRERGLIVESVNTLKLSGGVKLVKHIMKGTLFFEGLGALILSLSFIQDYGVCRGIYYGIFHAVSAFCNAGFDVLGMLNPYGSLVSYVGNPVINITIMALIIVGGLGFVVWEDIYEKKWHFHRYLLQTKVVLSTTVFLILTGALLIYIAEYQNAFLHMSQSETFLGCFFQSVTTRTAGFNTIDITLLSRASRLVMMILMFIGGSPGSTAGGMKTTTCVVLIGYVYATMTYKEECQIFHRRFDDQTVKKAFCVLLINLCLVIGGCLLILLIQPQFIFEDVMFEVISALGTVGISTGITRDFTIFSKLVIIFLMFSGRVGSLTFAFTLTRKKKITKCINPAEKVAIG